MEGFVNLTPINEQTMRQFSRHIVRVMPQQNDNPGHTRQFGWIAEKVMIWLPYRVAPQRTGRKLTMSASGDDSTNTVGHSAHMPERPSVGKGEKKHKPETPHLTPAAEAARQKRLADEAEALRANLRRRKAQARARNAMETSSDRQDLPESGDASRASPTIPETP